MKNTQKVFVLIVCTILCAAVFSCAGGGQAAAGSTTDGFGEGVPFVGEMASFTDENDRGNSTINMQVTQRDGMTAWRFTGNVTTRFQYGFVGWMFEPDAATLELLKTARAISFMYLGDGKRLTVKYRISTVRDHAHHEFHFSAEEPGVPQRVEVPVRFFQQPAWGNPVRLNQANAVDISWQTHESWRPGTFEALIWDVRIHP